MKRIGIIGGSGLYAVLENPDFVEKETEYGKTSDMIAIGEIAGKGVAFIPRHGRDHTIPPHKVPYKANIEALHQMGVERIIATCAVGSLKPEFTPGDFVFFDQFINATYNREETFFDGPGVVHVSLANPYCSGLRNLAFEAALSKGIKASNTGTVIVINGPRFSTKAESRHFADYADAINMTQYPEVALAKERGICYLGIGIVTDYDTGLEGNSDIKPVSFDEIGKIFKKSTNRLKELIVEIIEKVPNERSCDCKNALEGAEVKV